MDGHALAGCTRLAGHRGRVCRESVGVCVVDGPAMEANVAELIESVAADLGTGTTSWSACTSTWRGTVEELVRRLAARVARGGTTILVGHHPIDPAAGAATAATGQGQVSVDAALAALGPDRWEPVVASERPQPTAGTGVDAVIRARRRC